MLAVARAEWRRLSFIGFALQALIRVVRNAVLGAFEIIHRQISWREFHSLDLWLQVSALNLWTWS